jgi:hypothetical protein
VIVTSLFISIFAIYQMMKMPPLEKLEHYSGKVVGIKKGWVYTRDSSDFNDGVLLHLDSSNIPFGSWYTEDINAILAHVKKGDKAEVWLYEEDGILAQVVVNRLMLISYTRCNPVDIGFAIGGFVLFVFSLWMAIKFPEGVSERIAEEKANEAKNKR